MSFIIGTMKYPSHMQNEVIKKYLQIAPKYTLDENVAEQLCAPVTTTEQGVVVKGVWEVKPGKLEQALAYFRKFYYEFINIENLEYSIDVWYTFEEAAGITKFKQKGQEAEKKLQRTSENMKQVENILSEVKRSYNSLKNQSEKTIKYRKFRTDIFLHYHQDELTR